MASRARRLWAAAVLWLRRWGVLVLLALILAELRDTNEQLTAMRNWMNAGEHYRSTLIDEINEVQTAVRELGDKIDALER